MKKQGQKYQNVYAFHHNKSSKKTKKILSYPISGLCGKCTKVIEWKKQYRKYKPLTVVRKCCKCEQKAVKDAYHLCCHPCARREMICAKCLNAFSEQPEKNEENVGDAECCFEDSENEETSVDLNDAYSSDSKTV